MPNRSACSSLGPLLLSTLAATTLTLGCAPASSSFDDATASVQRPIVGGSVAAISDYPSTVAITDPSGEPFCSGTLVGPRVVVTAAHCLTGRSTDDTRIVYGFEVPSHAPAEARLTPGIVRAHPDYNPSAPQDDYGLGQTNDLGAIVLADPIPNAVIAPILPWSDIDTELTANREMHIVGYGVYDNATQQSGVLYRGITPHVRHTTTELLAGRPGEADTCYGDSGGPAYIVTSNTLWLVGATSRAWANAVKACGESTIYTTVSYYADWLASLPGADIDGGITDGGFEGGGWPPATDASGGSLLDVNPACLPPKSECNPLTNEGCEQDQVCRLDRAASRVRCEDGATYVSPGGMCDQSTRLCPPGYHCGPSIKCEKLCCTSDDCPSGVACTSYDTLLGNIGTCGVVYEDQDAAVAEAGSDADAPDSGTDAAPEQHAADAADDADAHPDATPSGSGDYPGDPIDQGCGCVVASGRSGDEAVGLTLLIGAALLVRMRSRRERP